MPDKKSYYAIIPATVRYNKTITANAKLLYGEITALCNEQGHCWAKNEYFAELYGVSKTSISKWISSLVDAGYIQTRTVYAEGTKQIVRRYIYIADPIEEKLNTYLTKVKDPIEEKLKDNNTNRILQKNIDTKVSIGQVQKDEYGKPEINEMLELWEQNISPITANKKKNRNACSNLLKKYGKDQLVGYIRLVYAAKGHRYAPAIADFVDLQYKADKLRLWAEKQTTTGAVATKAAYEKQNQQNYQIDEDF